MRRAAQFALGLLVATLVFRVGTGFLDGPLGPFPGGPFLQPAAPCEGVSWERFADLEETQLEVRPESPRTITTWSVVHEGRLFLPADFLTPWKRWPADVEADDRIRLRLAGEVFACRARPVADEARIAALREAIATKYAIDPDSRAARVEVWWFEVVPR